MAVKQDLTGHKFGKLTVVSEVNQRDRGRIYWLCQCECGKQKEVAGRLLKNGAVSSCGCLINAHKKNDITGQRFGMLLVLRESPQRKEDGHVAWDCLCDCGKIATISGNHIRRGTTKSCGCYVAIAARKRFTTHGKSPVRIRSPEYRSWCNMRTRCFYKNDKHYKDYGGRNIGICDRWLNSFQCFLEDMGSRPPGTSLDRIDNDKGYSPENCRWATPKEQANNRRPIRIIRLKDCVTGNVYAGRSKTPAWLKERLSATGLSLKEYREKFMTHIV